MADIASAAGGREGGVEAKHLARAVGEAPVACCDRELAGRPEGGLLVVAWVSVLVEKWGGGRQATVLQTRLVAGSGG